jgi:hypothetical protein
MFGYTSALKLSRSGTPEQLAAFESEVNDAIADLYRPLDVDGTRLAHADERLVNFERAKEAHQDDQRVALASFSDVAPRPEFWPDILSNGEDELARDGEEALEENEKADDLEETRVRLHALLQPDAASRDKPLSASERHSILLEEYLQDAPILRNFEQRVHAVRSSRLTTLLADDIMNFNISNAYELEFDPSEFKSSLFEVYDTSSLLRALSTSRKKERGERREREKN